MKKIYDWHDLLADERKKTYFSAIIDKIQTERALGKLVYPTDEQLFTAFKLTSFANIKVVILGQDPYHGAGQAHGLAFSVLPNVKIPPSLRNIYKELESDIIDFKAPNHGYLEHWAKQGVLLLNTVLSVEDGNAHSHADYGWETFTDKVIEVINQHQQNVVFLLWGSHAQKKGRFIDREKHNVLNAAHPSPLSAYRGFFCCNHFSKANNYLRANGKAEIKWQFP